MFSFVKKRVLRDRRSLTARLAVAALAIAASAIPTPSKSAFSVILGCNMWNTPFCNAAMTPISGWTGHVFHLSQAYPATAAPGPQPWLAVDPKHEPNRYANVVLSYFYEGNIHGGSIENDFDPATNHVRAWYNAPFQDLGTFGREFVHGLTMERNSKPGELTPEQISTWTNYAVGYYNAPGATVLHNVWSPWRAHAGSRPDIDAGASVPEGTVAAKLLYTTASPTEVPFIATAPVWNAYLYKDLNHTPKGPTDPRVIGKVRLLQIDIAVKDHRAGSTGWFFGTFVYGGGPDYHGAPLGTGWRNVAPVGLMWGNDPGYAPPAKLQQTWLNPSVKMAHYGYQNRLNGPVDNPVSSCMSCHASGEINRIKPTASGSGMIAPIPMPNPSPTPPGNDVARWFQNLGPSQPFDSPGFVSTGYSLQVMDGIRNYYTYVAPASGLPGNARVQKLLQAAKLHADDRSPRDGGTTH